MANSISVQIRDKAAKIELNRPQRLNALDADMASSLRRVIADVAEEKSVRTVWLAGTGSAFMAGGDLTYFASLQPKLAEGDYRSLDSIFSDIHATIAAIYSMPKPVVACVHGAVAGFGMSLMMACDLAMAAQSTSFTLAYNAIGASPDGGATYALPRVLGVKRAMELALLGERFDSARALQIGLVNWVVPDEEIESRCGDLVRRLSRGPALAYANSKKLINTSLLNTLNSQLEAERECFYSCTATNDFKEGISAFLAKRKPHFEQ